MLQKLFSPVQIAGLTIKKRVAMTSMGEAEYQRAYQHGQLPRMTMPSLKL